MAVQTAASHSATDAQVRNYDDDVFNSRTEENGIFVMPHYNNKKYNIRKSPESERKRRYIYPSARTLLIYKIIAATFIQYLALSAETSAGETRSTTHATEPITLIAPPGSPNHYHECGSIDIRHRCDYFGQLENCTVITGYLIILLFNERDVCNYDKYRFPHLREITDFLMIHDNHNLTTFRIMFPNLTVIRGRRLLSNYAMGITQMKVMEAIEFPSLVALQRGHVFVGFNQRLCYLNTVNFDRLTLAPGENHIIPENKTECAEIEQPCIGCLSGYCWSNKVCQKFENDNILNLQQGIQHCDAQCLGGCNNRTSRGCAVCRSWTDHATCVAKCPEDKYASEHYLRCYTREECTVSKRLFIYKNQCVADCPHGYRLNNATKECDSCGGVNECPVICEPSRPQFGIFSLSDVERLRGCQILNGNVIILLRYHINVQELIDNFRDVREITGYLKVYDSPHLVTLNFFENLEIIRGNPLEHEHFALVIYNNPKLEEIWPLKNNLELVNGGIYIYLNNRLCNRVIRNFKINVKHDHRMDSIYMSDLEVLCSPERLILAVEAVSHKSFKLTWLKDQTTDEVEILYQSVVGHKPPVLEDNNMDIPVCERIHWQREIILSTDLLQNETHHFFVVDNLEPHTQYRYLIKSFGKENNFEARSELQLITTLPDTPAPPLLKIYKKSFDSLSVQWYYENREDQIVDFYRLEVYEVPDKKEIIDRRDYCENPLKPYLDSHNEDYDDCCSRRLEDREDASYKKQLRQEFACTLNQKEYCERSSLEDTNDKKANVLLTKRLEHRESNYTIRSLERYRTYVLQMQACNHAGCGSFNMIIDRTNYSLAAEKLYDLTACKVPNNNEFHIRFKEPKKPNGVIISYALHFRFVNSTKGPFLSHIRCLTRLEHERNKYLYVTHLNDTLNQFAVRVDSLGHRSFSEWVNITNCSKSELVSIRNTTVIILVAIIPILICLGAAGYIRYVCKKREVWTSMRRYFIPSRGWTSILPTEIPPGEDRRILVEDFNTVRFLNESEEDELRLG